MINFNGTLLSGLLPSLNLDNRGLNYGDSFFETMRYASGKILYWNDHYLRLNTTMQLLKMEFPLDFSREALESEIQRTVEASSEDFSDVRIKLLVWRKSGGKYFPHTREVEFAISCETLAESNYTLHTDDYEMGLFGEHSVASGALSTLKSTNRLINVMGSIFANENGYANCFLLNQNGRVVEGLNGNIFLVRDGSVKTPPLSEGCLNGIMRKQIIEILKNVDVFSISEASITTDELEIADEIWVTNVIVGLVPVTKFRNRKYGNDLAGKMISKMNKQLETV